jgi:hypothetical protein|nr:MAG TPA: holin [Caudoviricetes sp.]
MNRLTELLILLLERMQDVASWLKAIILASITAVIDYYAPVHNFLTVILVLATFDILAGILADNGDWKKNKFLKAFLYLGLYGVFVLLFYWLGIMMEQEQESVKSFTAWLSWVFNYYYVTNILRNLNIKFPDSKPIAFLYWVITIKFISNISFLEEFQKSKLNKEEKQ